MSEAHQVHDLGLGVLPAEVLEDIFLRLDDAADVVRAAAACKLHRRVVRDRRYRFLHPPPVLGFLESMGIGGILHASLKQAADFTFSFLPMAEQPTVPWLICDARDGRVLLSRRRSADGGGGATATFLDLVICDPLYRRYVQIQTIPEDLWPRRYSTEMGSEPFLLPDREEEEDDSRFRVIYNWVCKYKFIAFLFDSGSTDQNSKWSVATTFSFLLPKRVIDDPMRLVRHRHYVRGRFYWVHRHESLKHMIVLDPIAMKFSIAGLPSGTGMQWGNKVQAVVDAGVVNRLGMAILGPGRNLHLYRTWQTSGGSGSAVAEWRHDKHHQLPEGYTRYYISAAPEGYLVLLGWHHNIEAVPYFILDLKTLQVERFCKSVDAVYYALPYARFPPSILSPPCI